MRVVSNSSPLIALAKIGMLDILRKDVVIPKAVFVDSHPDYWCIDPEKIEEKMD